MNHSTHEIQVNTHTNNAQIQGSVAALSNGGFVTTWTSWQQDGDRWGIYGQHFDATGTKVGSEFQVNTFTTNSQQQSSITALEDGGFVITWSSQEQNDPAFGIFGQHYDANGSPVGPEFHINTYTDQTQTYSAVTSLKNGGFVVTWSSWQQDNSGYGVYGQRYDANGAPVGSEFQVNHFTDDQQHFSSITGLDDGGFVITWSSSHQDPTYGVYGQRYNANGDPVGNEFQINSHTASIQFDSAVTTLEDGSFVVTWSSYAQDGSSYGIYGRRYDRDGTALTAEFQINTFTDNNQSYSAVTALPDGGFFVSWSSLLQDGSDWGVYGQQFDANGVRVGSEVLINQTTEGRQFHNNLANGQGIHVATGGYNIDTLADGRVVAIWDGNGLSDDEGVIARVLDVGIVVDPGTPNMLMGDNGNNRLIGTPDDDVILGKGGNDRIRGEAGADQLDGGDGLDTVDYRTSDDGVTVNLATNSASGGHAQGDTITNFERVSGSRFADDLTGDNGRNRLFGRGGRDTILGGAGNDQIRGDGGADRLDGGDGNKDLVDYDRSNAGVTVNLDLNTARGGHAQGDTILNFEQVAGSQFADDLTGDNGKNTIRGRDGDDLITGAGGRDRLFGDDGDDLINGGAGRDRIRGGAGADILSGGGGQDTFQWDALDDSLLASFDRIIDLRIGVDRIDASQPVTAPDVTQLGSVASLNETDIQAVLTSGALVANGAATFNVGSQTFLALNDATDGYVATQDALIEITGFQGDLSNLAIF